MIESLSLPSSIVQILHGARSKTQTRLNYNLGLSRTYLKGYGLIDNSRRGIWSLTALGVDTERVDPEEVLRAYREAYRERKGGAGDESDEDSLADDSSDDAAPTGEELPTDEAVLIEDSSDENASWRETPEALLSMSPDAFERLCQRLLREAGFIEVAVTGRSGDGGIDGHGIIRLAGLISPGRVSVQAIFQ